MPAKRPRQAPARSPRAAQLPPAARAAKLKRIARARSAAGASRPLTYQVGELWDECESAFFGPYFDLLRRRLSASNHPAPAP